MDNQLSTPMPVSEEILNSTTPKASSNTWKYVIGAIIVILLIISSFFGYSYKSVTKELDTAKQTIASLSTKINTSSNSETISTPVLLGGKIAYQTTTVQNSKSATSISDLTSTNTSTKSFEQTITKKGNTLFGGGYGTDGSENFLIQSDLLGPFGFASTASFSFIPTLSIKEAVVFITFKP